jgi:hypothetical protein
MDCRARCPIHHGEAARRHRCGDERNGAEVRLVLPAVCHSVLVRLLERPIDRGDDKELDITPAECHVVRNPPLTLVEPLGWICQRVRQLL